jgi:two-component system, NarL family, invasion response regulator UvrY
MIRIMIVDDHEMVLRSWKSLLENNPDFEVIALCDKGEQAIVLGMELQPDIMLVDVKMEPMNGFTVTEKLAQKVPSIKIIGLSVNNQPRYANRMMKLGARGYLTKTSTLGEINQAIREVYAGRTYLCEEIQKKLRTVD